jgi:hypothetical protein
MKKIIILGLMLITMSMPMTLNASVIDWLAALILPEYSGDINNPDVYVIEKGDGIWVVRINGQIYVFKPNK